MRARKRPVFFGPESQLCMQFGFTQSSETECNGAIDLVEQAARDTAARLRDEHAAAPISSKGKGANQ